MRIRMSHYPISSARILKFLPLFFAIFPVKAWDGDYEIEQQR